MFEELWSAILDLTAQFVIPDWGAVVLLLPIFVMILVVAVLVWLGLSLHLAAPARRGKQRIEPKTPAGIHMPGPSFSPILAAFGAFTVFLGLVFGGPLLIVGAIILVLTLLYWLAEALRVYDRDLGETAPALPVVVHDGPPEGVHMPGPSFRPILGALGTAMLMLGLVFGEWLLLAGVIALIATLLGWLVDARKEYVKTVEADTTGHLENIPAPRPPTLLLAGMLWLLIGAAVIQLGWVPPRPANGSTGAAASAEPGEPTTAPPGLPGSSGGAVTAPSGGPVADIVLTAKNIAFDATTITGPADVPFTLALVNDDAGTPHNVEFLGPDGQSVWKGEIFNGVDTRVYDVGPLPAAEYRFLCSVHPTMAGTATLKP